MGNVNGVMIENPDESDQEFLQMQVSAMFNDSFVHSIFDRLPCYDPKEAEEKKNKVEVDVPSHEALKLKKLMDIFSHSKRASCKVEDFEVLSVSKDTANSGFCVSNTKRNRLLLRVFQAYWNSLSKAAAKFKASSSSDDDEFAEENKFLVIPPVIWGSNAKISEVNQGDVVSAMSVEMCLTLARTLGMQNASLFSAMAESLLKILVVLEPLSLSNGGTVEQSPVLTNTLKSIQDFARNALGGDSSIDPAIESSALGLLLATGLVTGSVLTVLQVAKRLSDVLCKCVLPPLVMDTLQKYIALTDTYELSVPDDTFVLDKFAVTGVEQPSTGNAAQLNAHPELTSIATDGSALYVYNGIDYSLIKVGTGFHGTLAGEVIASCASVKETVKPYSKKVDSDEAGSKAGSAEGKVKSDKKKKKHRKSRGDGSQSRNAGDSSEGQQSLTVAEEPVAAEGVADSDRSHLSFVEGGDALAARMNSEEIQGREDDEQSTLVDEDESEDGSESGDDDANGDDYDEVDDEEVEDVDEDEEDEEGEEMEEEGEGLIDPDEEVIFPGFNEEMMSNEMNVEEWVATIDEECEGRAHVFVETFFNLEDDSEDIEDVENHRKPNYFEIEVLNIGVDKIIGIGFADPDVFDVDADEMPGWHEGSYGYHSDDGRLFGVGATSTHTSPDPSHPWVLWDTGDTMGFGIDVRGKRIFYTKNGVFLGYGFTNLQYLSLSPIITFKGVGCSVRLNSGAAPFMYNGPEVLCRAHGATTKKKVPKLNSKFAPASIVIANNKLYLRSLKLLDKSEVAVFNLESLHCEDVISLSEPYQLWYQENVYNKVDEVPTLVEVDNGKTEELESEKFEFTITKDEGLCIACSGEGKFSIVSASVNNSIDIMDRMGQFVLDGRLVVKDVAHVIATLNLNVETGVALPSPTLTVVGQVHKTPIDTRVNQALNRAVLTMSSDGNQIYLLERCSRNPDERAILINVFSEVVVQSAFFSDKGNNSGKDVTSIVVDARRMGTANDEVWTKIKQGVVMSSDDSAAPFFLHINIVEAGGEVNQWTVDIDQIIPWSAYYENHFVKKLNRKQEYRLLTMETRDKIVISKMVTLSYPSTVEISHDSSQANWHMFTNGHQLVLGRATGDTSSSHKLNFHKFNVIDGSYIDSLSLTYLKSNGIPMLTTYDMRNNFLWSYEPALLQVLRWRNDGFPVKPSFNHSKGVSLPNSADLVTQFLSSLQSHREDDDLSVSNKQGILLYALLEQISDRYNLNYDLDTPAAERDLFNEIKITLKGAGSSGNDDMVSVCIRGKYLSMGSNPTKGEKGFFVIILHALTLEVIKMRHFGTHENSSAVDRLSDFLDDLSENKLELVLVVCCSKPKENLNQKVYEQLKSIGATDINKHSGSVETLVIIGRKGLKSGQAFQRIEDSDKKKVHQFKIPYCKSPLRVEASAATIEMLMQSAKHFFKLIVDQTAAGYSADDAYYAHQTMWEIILHSCLKLLNVNVFQLVKGSAIKEYLNVVNVEMRESLRCFMFDMLNSEVVVRNKQLEIMCQLLFVSSFDLLYPTSSSQLSLLSQYIEKYKNESINNTELFLLEFVLSVMSKPVGLAKLVARNDGSDSSEVSEGLKLLSSLELIVRGETSHRLNGLTADATAVVRSSSKSLSKAAVETLTTLCKLLLCKSSQPFIANPSALSVADKNSSKLAFHVLLSLATLASDILKQSVGANTALVSEGLVTLQSEIDSALKISPVGSLLAFVFNAVSNLIKHCGYSMLQPSMDIVHEIIETLTSCHVQLNQLIACIPVENVQFSDTVSEAVKRFELVESEHPYRSNMDVYTPYSFPGALSLEIVFDQASRSENSCDYIIFYNNMEEKKSLHPQTEKYCGRDGSENWPGCGGRPPLVLEVSELVVFFHSDASVEDWGYKFTITAVYPRKSNQTVKTHWLVKLDFELVQCMSTLASTLVAGQPWQEELESSCAHWMENSLVKPELLTQGGTTKSNLGEEETFLLDLIERPEGSLARRFALTMRSKVPEDQGTVEVINNAVYATCAAILKSNGLVAEALAVAKGIRADNNIKALVKAWKSGQKMRSFFDLGDLRSILVASSATASLDDEALRVAASTAIVDRVKFLLRTPRPTVAIAQEESSSSTGADGGLTTPIPMRRTESDTSPFSLSKDDGDTLGSLVKHGESRWKLAGKAVGLKRQMSEDTVNVATMWKSLVEESVVFDKLKNILTHRRKVAEKTRSRGELTVTEKILAFLQSNVDIRRLEELNSLRNKRAIYRSKGFDMYANIVSSLSSVPYNVVISLNSFVAALKNTKREEGCSSSVVHYMNTVEGCSPEQAGLLCQKYAYFLNCIVQLLSQCYSKYKSCAQGSVEASVEKASWVNAIIACLRACALDYEYIDHTLIYESGLLKVLEELLCDVSSSAIKDAADTLLEILVSRCVNMDTSTTVGHLSNNNTGLSNTLVSSKSISAIVNDDELPSELCKRLISLLVNRIEYNSKQLLGEETEAPKLSVEIADKGLLLIPGVKSLQKCSSGYTYPHIPLTINHTISCWIKRPYSSVLDCESQLSIEKKLAEGKELSDLISAGAFVMQGVDWPESDTDHSFGLHDIGQVTKVAENKLTVKWSNGKIHSYQYGKTEDDDEMKFEVAIVDPAVAGTIYTKGSSVLKVPTEARQSLPVWNYIGIELLADATVNIFVEGDAESKLYNMRNKVKVPCNKWTHVAIAFGVHFTTLFVNGEIAMDIPSEDAHCSAPQTYVSTKPFSVPEVPSSTPIAVISNGSPAYSVSFDPDTSLPQGCSIEIRNGEALINGPYNGAEGGSRSYPGIEGNPSYEVITSNNFSINLVTASDAVLDDEVCSSSCYEIKLSAFDPLAWSEMQTIVNKFPVTVGQRPAHLGCDNKLQASKMTASTALNSTNGFNGLIAGLHAFKHAAGKNEIDQLMRDTKPSTSSSSDADEGSEDSPPVYDDMAVLGLFATVRRGLDNLDSLYDSSIRRSFAHSSLMTAMFAMFQRGSPACQCAAYELCSAIFPALDVELVDGYAFRSGLIAKDESMLTFLLSTVGHAVNVWSRREDLSSKDRRGKLRHSSDAEYAIAMSQLTLLRAFASTPNGSVWNTAMTTAITDIIDKKADIVLTQLMENAEKDLSVKYFDSKNAEKLHLALGEGGLSKEVDLLYGLLMLLGGDFPVIYSGANAFYCNDSLSSMKEECLILGPASVPAYDLKLKDVAKMWDGLRCFGDAVAIMLISQPGEYMTVPRSHIITGSTDVVNSESLKGFNEFLEKSVGSSLLLQLFSTMTSINVVDSRDKLSSKVTVAQEELTFESTHPYADNLDVTKPISLPGAKQMIVTFDPQSATETNHDYLQFFKDASKTDTWGVKYTGRNGDQNFPGCEGRDPLVIDSDSAVLYFHSDGSTNDWGYKFTVKGECTRELEPPLLPTLPHLSILSHLKMMAMKAFHTELSRNASWLIAPSIELFSSLVTTALTPAPASTVNLLAAAEPKVFEFESTHPYDNSLDIYTPVSNPGVQRYSIVFDPETRTENNCDYIVFYTDSTHTTKCEGCDTFTGGKDGGSSNWPGLQDRPPFIIEGDSFVIYFHSDGSVNDWGYKMYVTAEYTSGNGSVKKKCIRGEGMLASAAAYSCYHLSQFLLDGPEITDNLMTKDEYDSYELAPHKKQCSAFVEVIENAEEEVDGPVINPSPSSPSKRTSAIPQILKTNDGAAEYPVGFKTCDSNLVVYSEANTASATVTTIASSGSQLLVNSEVGDWVNITLISPHLSGYLLRRSGDREHITTDTTVPGGKIKLIPLPMLESTGPNKKKDDSAESDDASKKKKSTKHPMYSVNDETTGKKSNSSKALTENPQNLIQSEFATLEVAIYEYSAIASIGYAFECLSVLIENWPLNSQPFSMQYFESLSSLLTYFNLSIQQTINSTLSEEEGIQSAVNVTTNSKHNKLLNIIRKSLDSLMAQSGESLGSAISIALDEDDSDVSLKLIDFAADHLTAMSGMSIDSTSIEKPYCKGTLQTFESPHNYLDNSNVRHVISFPGARRIEIVFDPECSTENNYDYINIKGADSETLLYPNKIHGYSNSGDRHWPGVNVPKVSLSVDYCVAHFISDGGTNAWGYKFTAYGIYEDPDPAEMQKYKEYQAKKKLFEEQKKQYFPELACWLLKTFMLNSQSSANGGNGLLSKQNSAGDVNSGSSSSSSSGGNCGSAASKMQKIRHDKLYNARMFRILRVFFDSAYVANSETLRNVLLQLFVVFMQEMSRMAEPTVELLQELSSLRESLIVRADNQYNSDTKAGTEMCDVSVFLQSLVQLILTVETTMTQLETTISTIKSFTQFKSISAVSLSAAGNEVSVWDPTPVEGLSLVGSNKVQRVNNVADVLNTRSYCSVCTRDCNPVDQFTWDFSVVAVSEGHVPLVGLKSDSGFEVSWNLEEQVLLVGAEKSVKYGQAMKTSVSAGDLISIKLHAKEGTVSFSVNSVSAGLAMGPSGSGAAVEASVAKCKWFATVSLYNLNDTIEYLNSSAVPSASSDKVVPSSIKLPDWLKPVQETYSLLTSYAKHEVPQYILNFKFLPFCVKKARTTVEFRTAADSEDCATFEKEVSIEGAEKLRFYVKDLFLEEGDRLEFIDAATSNVLKVAKGRATFGADATLGKEMENFIMRMSNAQSASEEPAPAVGVISVGDTVIRGPTWKWGRQDGGAGSTGVVTKIQDWSGTANGGVYVKWNTTPPFEGLYRNYETFNDVVKPPVTKTGESSSQSEWKFYNKNFCKISGSHIRIKLFTSNESSKVSRVGKFYCIPVFNVSTCMTLPLFQPHLKQLRSLYCSSSLSGDYALVKHINTLVRLKSISRDELLKKKWNEMTPSVEDLTRSSALKALFDSKALDVEVSPLDDQEGEEGATEPLSGGESTNLDVDLLLEMIDVTVPPAPAGPDAASLASITLSAPHNGFVLSGGYAYWAGLHAFDSLEDAREAAIQIYPECCGITKERENEFTLRASRNLVASSGGEISWLIIDPTIRPPAATPATPVPASAGASSTRSPPSPGRSPSADAAAHAAAVLSLISETSESLIEENSDGEDGEGLSVSSSSTDGSNDEDCEGGDNEDDNSGRYLHYETAEEADNSNVEVSKYCKNCSKIMSLVSAGTWSNGWTCDCPRHEGQEVFQSTDPLYACPTAVACNYGFCQRCWDLACRLAGDDSNKPKNNANTATSGMASPQHNAVLNVENKPIAAHYVVIQLLNLLLLKTLPFIDLSTPEPIPGSLTYLLLQHRGLLFEAIKSEPFNKALELTQSGGGSPDLMLSRSRARKHANSGLCDTDARFSTFGQAFRQLHQLPSTTFRRTDRIYTTKFMGEHAQDAGGPYRETFATYCSELQSPALPLFVKTPNGRHSVGYNREKWILNPGANTNIQMEMFAFLGKLMGLAIRSKEYLALNIPSFVWKLIVADAPNTEDLEGIDFSLVKSMDLLRTIENKGVDAAMFKDTFFETFTTNSSDDRTVELIPNGASTDVTFETRLQYCDAVLQYRFHEFDKQAAAIRKGLSTAIPISLLSLYTWDQLEEMVCGVPEVNVSLLESITEYSSCSASDPHVRLFWQAMNEFNNEERSALIKFTWGRSRLPLNAAGFAQRFKIQNFDKSPADSYFPVAHTCFFSLELPRYSTLEIMKERLRYAIFNCEAIDGDDTSTGMAVAAMGWEE